MRWLRWHVLVNNVIQFTRVSDIYVNAKCEKLSVCYRANHLTAINQIKSRIVRNIAQFSVKLQIN